MNSDNFFLIQIDEVKDKKNDQKTESYFMKVYEITEENKEVVEDPLLLGEIIKYMQCNPGEDTDDDFVYTVKDESLDGNSNCIEEFKQCDEDTENIISHDIKLDNYKTASKYDNLNLNEAEAVYNKLNETQKKIVDFIIQKISKASAVPIDCEEIFGISYVDDTDIWNDDIEKEAIVCGEEYSELVKLARVLTSSERKSILRKRKRAFKMPCEICGKMITQANIKIHMLVHNGEKKFACKKCPARFKTARGLNAHTNAHFGRRPFQCDECPKAYTSDTALRAHKMDHQERIHKCEVCGQCFSRKYSLTEHLRIHADKRIYNCNICGKIFSKAAKFKAHNRKHQGLPPDYPCTGCSKRFSKLSCMKLHMKKIHNISIVTRKMFFNSLPNL